MKSISAKLGIWPNDRLLVVQPDERIVQRIQDEHGGGLTVVQELPEGKIPLVLIWLREGDDTTGLANRYKDFIDHTGQLWFFFSKKEVIRKQRLTVTRETVLQDVARANLEMTKLCSIDVDTQAMGFVLPLRR